jgi:hypothetical protein
MIFSSVFTRSKNRKEIELQLGIRRFKGLGHETRIALKWYGLIGLG